MFRDECILLDKDDNVVGHANKKVSHVFAPESPRGLLHRAFSVFIFDAQGRLLLQKRAASKITFPNVWTNTCCSHPLYGFAPSEVDGPADVADGSVMGTKRAAIRKLDHELGVPPGTLDVGRFKFLTRLHYWAADVVTHGADSPWGEHEIDYILFCRCAACAALLCNPPPLQRRAEPVSPARDRLQPLLHVRSPWHAPRPLLPRRPRLTPARSALPPARAPACRADGLEVSPHAEEVDEVKWVSQPELQRMMEPGSGLLWSPWFRIIAQRFLVHWWADLDATFGTDKHVDCNTIHRFDPTAEHMGGGGKAGPWLDVTAEAEVGAGLAPPPKQ